MDFDFKHIQVPFRMHPGLARLDPQAHHLTPLDPASKLFREKRVVSDTAQAVFCLPGFNPDNALSSIRAHARSLHIAGLDGPHARLELLVEEDLALLDAATGAVPWMCVCVPSGWAPEEKLGLTLPAIHAPVADSAALAAAWPHLARLLTQGSPWERHVWTVSPSGRYDQHPRRHVRPDWPVAANPDTFASQCFLRTERQTFLPVHDRQGHLMPQAVFTIRVSVQPLCTAVTDAGRAQRLHDALSSMGENTLAYKHLGPARERLLAWLACRAGEPANGAP